MKARALLALLTLTVSAHAQQSTAAIEWWRAFNEPLLTSMIERSFESNPDIKAAAARVNEVRAARATASAALKPSISVSQVLMRSRGVASQGAPNNGPLLLSPLDADIVQGGLESFWDADPAGRLKQSVKVADANLRAAEEEEYDVRLQIAAQIARNYISLRGLQCRLRIVYKNVELQQDSLQLTQARFKAGLAPELDVIRAESQLRQTKAEAPPLEAEIDRVTGTLAVLLGLRPTDFADEVADENALPEIPELLPATAPAELLLRRPDLQKHAAELAAAAARVGMARAELYPKLTLVGVVGRAAGLGGLALGLGNFLSVGPSLQLPVFTGGRIRSSIAIEEARLHQAKIRYEAASLNALFEVQHALTGFRKAKEATEELVVGQDQFRDAVVLTGELYSKGLGDYLAVLDAQRQLLKIEDGITQGRTDMTLYLVDLYKAMGGEW